MGVQIQSLIWSNYLTPPYLIPSLPIRHIIAFYFESPSCLAYTYILSVSHSILHINYLYKVLILHQIISNLRTKTINIQQKRQEKQFTHYMVLGKLDLQNKWIQITFLNTKLNMQNELDVLPIRDIFSQQNTFFFLLVESSVGYQLCIFINNFEGFLNVLEKGNMRYN